MGFSDCAKSWEITPWATAPMIREMRFACTEKLQEPFPQALSSTRRASGACGLFSAPAHPAAMFLDRPWISICDERGRHSRSSLVGDPAEGDATARLRSFPYPPCGRDALPRRDILFPRRLGS